MNYSSRTDFVLKNTVIYVNELCNVDIMYRRIGAGFTLDESIHLTAESVQKDWCRIYFS